MRFSVAAPHWLRDQVPLDWYERYGNRIEDFRWPEQTNQREAIAAQIGIDGSHLLQALFSEQAPGWLREIPAVEVLRRVWVQQYHWEEDHVCWRGNDNIPPASVLICSPYDPEAHLSVKRSTIWTGYKVHVTETCDEDSPHLITHVETTSATTQDKECTADIHQALADKQVLPSEHFMDTGYVDGEHLVSCRA